MAIANGIAVFCVIPVAVIVLSFHAVGPSQFGLVTKRVGIRGARHHPIRAEE